MKVLDSPRGSCSSPHTTNGHWSRRGMTSSISAIGRSDTAWTTMVHYLDTTGDIRLFAQRRKEGDDNLDETLKFSFFWGRLRGKERLHSGFPPVCQYLMISNQYATYLHCF